MRLWFFLVLGFAITSNVGTAAELKVGDQAPTFQSTDDAGNPWKSADHVGKKVLVIYFYPADFTGGCTKQACAYRDDFKKLEDAGAEVVGVSGDTVKTHELFKKDHMLPFTLLADDKGEVAREFGLPVKVGAATAKVKVDGKALEIERGATAPRWTFVIGKDGKISYIDKKASPTEDSKKVAEVVSKLNK